MVNNICEPIEKFWEDKGILEDTLEYFKDLQKASNLVPFVGSGMSVRFGFPTWSTFLQNVINRYFGEKDEKKEKFQDMLNKCDFLNLAEKLNKDLKDGALQQAVKEQFDPTRKKPVDGEQNYLTILKSSGITKIITTNFDTVIEDHLGLKNTRITLPSTSIDSGTLRKYFNQKGKMLIKLHGTFDDADSIILTTTQFKSSYCDKKNAIVGLLKHIWQNSTLLFMGCGLRKDPLIEKMVKFAEQEKWQWHYAILEYPNKDVETVKRNLAGMHILPIWFEPKKYDQILAILKKILDIRNISKQKSNMYLDKLASEVQDNEKLQDKLVNAIMVQCDVKNSFKCSESILNKIYQHIVQSNNKYLLSIKGEPGTGKSTILSLLYLKCLKNNTIEPFLIDTHKYDNCERKEAKSELEKQLGNIEKKFKKGKKNILFIDGINEYIRGDKELETTINNWIETIKHNTNIKFVVSIGTLYSGHYPKEIYLPSEDKNVGIIHKDYEKTIVFNTVEKFDNLVDKTLDYYINIVGKNEKVSADEELKNKFNNELKKLGEPRANFRIVLFLIKRYYADKERFFSKDIAEIFDNYYISKNEDIDTIAKYVATSLLANKPQDTSESQANAKSYYLFKSKSITNYFIAHYYIHTIECDNRESLHALFNCILTRGINIFAVYLMNIKGEDEVKNIVKNIGKLMKEKKITLHQKNQLAFMLGRVKFSKQKAIEILTEQYRKYIAYVTTEEYRGSGLSNDIGVYIRTIGISLILLEHRDHEEKFYHALIYNGYLNQINRNFHIQYFTTNGYKFDDKLELRNDDLSPEKINSLCDFLQNSFSWSYLLNINIITFLNLTLYKLFALNKDSKEEIDKAKEAIREISKKNSKYEIHKDVTKHINEVLNLLNDKIYYEKLMSIYENKSGNRSKWLKKHFQVDDSNPILKLLTDHTWGCCQLALLFLPKNKEFCRFKPEKDYDLSKIILMLTVHDYVPKEDGREKNEVKQLTKLNTLPHFCNFNFIKDLVDELNKSETYNSKIAHDILEIETLVQIYIYKDMLKEKLQQEIEQWYKEHYPLKTSFGQNLLKFLDNQFKRNNEIF